MSTGDLPGAGEPAPPRPPARSAGSPSTAAGGHRSTAGRRSGGARRGSRTGRWPGADDSAGGWWRRGSSTSPGRLAAKIVILGLAAALALWGAFPLIHNHAWVGLGVLVAVTALIFYIYVSPRQVPAKYLLPGTLFLIAFQVIPVLYTASTAVTN